MLLLLLLLLLLPLLPLPRQFCAPKENSAATEQAFQAQKPKENVFSSLFQNAWIKRASERASKPCQAKGRNTGPGDSLSLFIGATGEEREREEKREKEKRERGVRDREKEEREGKGKSAFGMSEGAQSVRACA